MEILFARTKFQKLFSSAAKPRRKFGPRMAEKIEQRLAELEAATTLK